MDKRIKNIITFYVIDTSSENIDFSILKKISDDIYEKVINNGGNSENLNFKIENILYKHVKEDYRLFDINSLNLALVRLLNSPIKNIELDLEKIISERDLKIKSLTIQLQDLNYKKSIMSNILHNVIFNMESMDDQIICDHKFIKECKEIVDDCGVYFGTEHFMKCKNCELIKKV